VNRLQTELNTAQLQNQTLRKTVEGMKSGISDTRGAETQKLASLQASWEDEKKELVRQRDDIKRLKAELSQKTDVLENELETKNKLNN